MNYLSVCSGVEAASVAWKGLGWNPLGFSEIEKFPSEVLNHHYPNVPNLGDMTKYKEWNFGKRSVDLVVGGTPCQSFSVAGLRKGMEDPRGNLALTFCAILDKFRPKWFVWENVPGVLSSNKGRDFGSFLGAVAELGYGASYRVLDAQNFGVPQRRRRVFVVGHLGDWKPTAEVLFESESLQWHPKKSRQTRKDSPGYIEGGFGAYNKSDVGGTSKASGGVLGGGSETFVLGGQHPNAAIAENQSPTLTSAMGTGGGHIPVLGIKVGKHQQDFIHSSSGKMSTLPAGTHGNAGHYTKTLVTHVADKAPTLTSSAAGFSRPGNDSTADSQYIALAENTIGRQPLNGGNGNGFTENGPMYTLNATGVHGVAHTPISWDSELNPNVNKMGTLVRGGQGGRCDGVMQINMAVRRLTPVECERLQGFPDNYTNIKENCPDGPRYKAMGNSMAVPVMKWIGTRINNYKEDTDAV
jgi:DNA (cytosine-5)-methyltransferase 1